MGRNGLIAKTLEELNRKIADREKEIQSIASTVFSSAVDVEDKEAKNPGDEAYSPSGSLTPPQPPPSTDIDVSLPPNLHQILATIKEKTATSSTPAESIPPMPPSEEPLPPPPAPPEIKVSRDPRQQRVEPPPPGLEDEYSELATQQPPGYMIPPYGQPMMMPPGYVGPIHPMMQPTYPAPILPPNVPLPASWSPRWFDWRPEWCLLLSLEIRAETKIEFLS
ncbi:protein diaphanous homolog 1-like [Diaphorina citri]|uniref:Protein diaphanous homolog 1-like n=1 Tax=Diaphorina citri TaxID=121845 RepID=A0A1S3D4E6_DIACI|nr:protein diaphanous homolog 1-like [Diaphorina citri]